jgi:hypothetical protein
MENLQGNPKVNLIKFLKKWEIINNVVQGIIKSISVISVEKYHIVNDIDFRIHNKIEMQSVFRNVFERCKFKDYCPFVFEQIRRLSGVANESFIKSIGLNTFQSAFVHRLIVLLAEHSAGRSGSFFFVSADGRYLIKTIKESEFEVLLGSIRKYLKHLSENPESLLA